MTPAWTMLLIFDGRITAGGIYPSRAACIAAIEPLGATLGYDYQAERNETNAPSVSPRPKARPEIKEADHG